MKRAKKEKKNDRAPLEDKTFTKEIYLFRMRHHVIKTRHEVMI